MEAWQSISNSHQEYLIRFSSKRRTSHVSLFRDSKYLRQLNAALALELGTVDLYCRCLNLPDRDAFSRGYENHRDNSKLIRNLIISNRGIPDFESTTISIELCILARRVGAQFGRTISKVSAIKLCENMENTLRKKYLEIISQAPYRDRSQLQSLLFATKSNLISLNSLK